MSDPMPSPPEQSSPPDRELPIAGERVRRVANPFGSLSGWITRRISVPIIVALFWEAFARVVESPFLPPFSSILERVRELWLSGPATSLFLSTRVFDDLLPSLYRVMAGYGMGVFLGIALGVLIGLSRKVGDYIDPLVHFARGVPKVTLVPAFILLLGIGDVMKITLIGTTVVFPILLNTIDGVRSVDHIKLDTARVFGTPPSRRLTHIVLPAAAPKIFAGLKIGMAVALIMMVVSEMAGATDGIGYGILHAQRTFRVLDMWAGIIVLGLLGNVLNVALTAVERRLLAWHAASHSLVG